MQDYTPAKKYRPTPSDYFKSGLFSLLLIGCYHLITWILYTFLLTTLENQMIGDEHEPEFRLVMFCFSFITLVALAAVSFVCYLKNGNRKRAYLTATSLEVRGDKDGAMDGRRTYRKAAFYETLLSLGITAVVWLPSACFYGYAMATSGMGYGYGEAWFIESFFVGAVGLYQLFQSSLLGVLLGLAFLGLTGYFGRLYAHASWEKNRIRP